VLLWFTLCIDEYLDYVANYLNYLFVKHVIEALFLLMSSVLILVMSLCACICDGNKRPQFFMECGIFSKAA